MIAESVQQELREKCHHWLEVSTVKARGSLTIYVLRRCLYCWKRDVYKANPFNHFQRMPRTNRAKLRIVK